MREFLAFPFVLMAKGFAEIASMIDDEPCICFSLRDATEITEENIEDFFKDMEDDD